MVRRIVWSTKALSDLRAIFDYVARDSRFYAQVQVERIQAAAEKLARFPEIGRIVTEFPAEEFRQVLAGSYRVLYRIVPQENQVRVLAVVHVRRLLQETLIDQG